MHGTISTDDTCCASKKMNRSQQCSLIPVHTMQPYITDMYKWFCVDSFLDTITEMVTIFGDFMDNDNTNAGEHAIKRSLPYYSKNEVTDYD